MGRLTSELKWAGGGGGGGGGAEEAEENLVLVRLYFFGKIGGEGGGLKPLCSPPGSTVPD